tara:strand:+ start:871 stop:1188 length:318 start_codon:yes stop_codon:yes gene_type:complete
MKFRIIFILTVKLSAVILFLLIWKSALANQVRTTILVDLCNSCHAAAGQYNTEIPKINHLTDKQIEQIIKSYKYGKQHSTIMQRIVKGFSDQELENISKNINKND